MANMGAVGLHHTEAEEQRAHGVLTASSDPAVRKENRTNTW
jgi:hypothetical protein